MDNQLTKTDANDKIVNLINTMVPKAHQESAKLLMEENEKKDKYINELEEKLKYKNEEYSETFTQLEKKEKEIEDNRAKVLIVEGKELELTKRESKIILRETNQNHHDEIAGMKVTSAQSERNLSVQILETIFKPPALRTSIHKTIPVKEELYSQEMECGPDGNSSLLSRKSGEMHLDKNIIEDKKETQE